MAYRDGYNKKIIRTCIDCGKKFDTMFYVRSRISPFFKFVCVKHTPIDRTTYAVVELDNRAGALK